MLADAKGRGVDGRRRRRRRASRTPNRAATIPGLGSAPVAEDLDAVLVSDEHASLEDLRRRRSGCGTCLDRSRRPSTRGTCPRRPRPGPDRLPKSAFRSLPSGSTAMPAGVVHLAVAEPCRPIVCSHSPSGVKRWMSSRHVVDDVDRAVRADRDVERLEELAVLGAVAAPRAHEHALRCELLDAVVDHVGHVDGAIGRDRYASDATPADRSGCAGTGTGPRRCPPRPSGGPRRLSGSTTMISCEPALTMYRLPSGPTSMSAGPRDPRWPLRPTCRRAQGSGPWRWPAVGAVVAAALSRR